jgi:hypothetical protein
MGEGGSAACEAAARGSSKKAMAVLMELFIFL